MAIRHSYFDDLARQLKESGSIKRIVLRDLRDAVGKTRLGINVVATVQHELDRRDICFWPSGLSDNNHRRVIRVWHAEGHAAEFIDAVEEMSDESSLIRWEGPLNRAVQDGKKALKYDRIKVITGGAKTVSRRRR